MSEYTTITDGRPVPVHRVHLERDLHSLEQAVRNLGASVSQAIPQAMQALTTGDANLRHDIVARDRDADRLYQQIEQDGFALVARHAPVAGDLRLVTALLNTGLHLERIGDVAVNITTIAELSHGLPADAEVLGLLQAMAAHAAHMVTTAMQALADRDPALARSIGTLDDRLDELDREVFGQSVALDADAAQREWAVRMHELSRQLERAGDHAVDIAEQVWFCVTGEFTEFDDSHGPR